MIDLKINGSKHIIARKVRKCVRFFKKQIGLHKFSSHWVGLRILSPCIIGVDVIVTAWLIVRPTWNFHLRLSLSIRIIFKIAYRLVGLVFIDKM